MPNRRFRFFALRDEFKRLIMSAVDEDSFMLFHYWPPHRYATIPAAQVTDQFERSMLSDILVSDHAFDDRHLDRYQYYAIEFGFLDLITPRVLENKLLCCDIAIGSLGGEGEAREVREKAARRYSKVVAKVRKGLKMGLFDCATGRLKPSIGYTEGAYAWFAAGGQLCDNGDLNECYCISLT